MAPRSLAVVGASLSLAAAAAQSPSGVLTWFSASDTHFGHDAGNVTSFTKNSWAIAEMNSIAGNASWPATLGGGLVGEPAGVTVSGDLIDGGVNSGTSYDGCAQWTNFSALYGLNGTDGMLRYRVYEGRGNHDGPNSTMPAPRGCALSSSQHVVARNRLRAADPGFGVTGLSDPTQLHYSWTWNVSSTCSVHFVHMNLFPGHGCGSADQPNGEGGAPGKPSFACTDGDLGYAEESLSFLASDLATHAAAPGVMVVTFQHYALDDWSNGWYNADQRSEMWATLGKYNTLAVMAGHTHTAALYSFSATTQKQGPWDNSNTTGYLDVIVAPATQKEGAGGAPLPSEFMVIEAAMDEPSNPSNRAGTLRVAQRVGSGWGTVLGSKRFTC